MHRGNAPHGADCSSFCRL